MIPSLTRKQVDAIHALMLEYDDAREVTFSMSSTSGIGTNIYATIKYLGYREVTIDITDYENW
jgi:hypothetical protein